MKNIEFRLREEEEFIKLGQLLKACNVVSNGGEAKLRILNGDAIVNGNVEKARGKKIKEGDTVKINNININIIK